MIIVRVNEKLEIEAKEGELLSQVIRRGGFSLETPCNGIGVCGKCKVIATGMLSSLEESEKKHVQIEKNERLACKAKVLGNVNVTLLKKEEGLSTINEGRSLQVPLYPSIKERVFSIEKQAKPIGESNHMEMSLSFIQALSQMEKDKRKEGRFLFDGERFLMEKRPGQRLLAVAVDIGTTGVSLFLVDLETGDTLEKSSMKNPQTEFGGDVLSRISFALEEKEGAKKLQQSICKGLEKGILELLGENYKKEDLLKVSISANTTMLHFLVGAYTGSIATNPYRPIFLEKIECTMESLGIKQLSSVHGTLLPGASAYVGADIVSGVVATGFDLKKNKSLFIDIGTNGEIVANWDGELVATSTAAGPCLEGMNISCGMRAEDGAMDAFWFDENEQMKFSTIGNYPMKGICGSGLLDFIAHLVRKGYIQKSGKFKEERLKESFGQQFRDKRLYLTDEIYLSQGDIRQIQLAKGAIATGIIMLLKELKTDVKELEEIFVAGAFGYHLNPQSILEIGLIPKGFEGKISFVGNSSVEGAKLSLLNREMEKKMSQVAKQIKVLELSMRQDFQDCFVMQLHF